MTAQPNLLLILAVALAFPVVAIVLMWLLVLRRQRDGQPRCGRCDYRVEGLTSDTCPECGGVLTEVGIVRGRRRWLHVTPVFIVIWSLLIGLCGLIVAPPVAGMGPLIYHSSRQIIVEPNDGSFPSVTITMDMLGQAPKLRSFGNTYSTSNHQHIDGSRSATWSYTPPAKMTILELTTTLEFVDGEALVITHPDGVEPDVVLAWLDENADLPEEGISSKLVEDLCGVAELLSGGGTVTSTRIFPSGGSSMSMGGGRPPAWMYALLIVPWVIIWAVGVVTYRLIRKRQMRAAAAEL